MKRFVLVGDNTSGSLSPFIHLEFARQFNLKIKYKAINVGIDNLNALIDNLIIDGVSGINVTSPYKERFFKILKNHSSASKVAKSVNTIIVKEDGMLWGDNTDGLGLIKDLKRHDIIIKDQCLLICGAGGAVRGILASLIDINPAKIIIINRDVPKALLLASEFKEMMRIEVDSYDNLHIYEPNIVINATSNEDLFVDFNLKSKCVYYDLNYKQKTKLSNVIYGLGMLVEQAAISFELWHGKKPEVKTVLSSLMDCHAKA